MVKTTYLEAGRRALAEEMRRDPTVWAVGEDLGRGGVFGQYAGMAEEFGPLRISDAPISEAAILGAAVGAALAGTRPVVEMRFADFALCAVDELVNQAAKARYMFGGQGGVPLVVREPMGMWRSSAAQHSQSLEAWYVHIPGLTVVAPATPRDNLRLLKAAIRSDDPVVYMEHKGLWGLEEELGRGRAAGCARQRADRLRGQRRHRGFLVRHGPQCRCRSRGAGGRGRVGGGHRPAHALALGPRGGAGLGAQDRAAGGGA